MVQRTQEWCTYIFVILDLTYFFGHAKNVHYKGCLKQKNITSFSNRFWKCINDRKNYTKYLESILSWLFLDKYSFSTWAMQ